MVVTIDTGAASGKTSAMAARIIAFCSAMPNYQLLTTRSLAEKLGMSYRAVKDASPDPKVAAHRVRAARVMGDVKQGTTLWGNAETVSTFLSSGSGF